MCAICCLSYLFVCVDGYKRRDCKIDPIIMSCIGCEGLHFVQILNDDENERCRTSAGHISTLNALLNPSTMKLYYPCSFAKLRCQ